MAFLNKSLLQLVVLIILNCVGSGLLTLTPILAKFGISVFPAWILTAAGAFSVGMIFVKLGEYLEKTDYCMHEVISGPFSGGLNKFIKSAIFYGYWIFSAIGDTALAMIIVSGLSYFFPQFCSGFTIYVLIFGGVAVTNMFGSKTSTLFNQFLAGLKMLILLVMPIVVYFTYVKNPQPIAPGILSDIPKCMFLTLWPFVGMESIMMERNVNLKMIRPAMIIGVFFCLFIYIVNTYIMMATFPNLVSMNSPYANLFNFIFPGAEWIFSLALILIGIGSLHGWTHTAISTYESGEKMVPSVFRLRNQYGVPITPLVTSFIIPLINIFIVGFIMKDTNAFEQIITVCTSLTLFIYLFAILALSYLIILRRKVKLEDIVYIVFGSAYLVCAFIGSPFILNLISFGFFCICGFGYLLFSNKDKRK